jgi:HK97 gp10 family phage protein
MAVKQLVSVHVSDKAPILNVFRNLPGELQRKELQGAIFAASGVIQKAVRAAAPRGKESSRKTRRVWTTHRGKGRQRTKMRLVKPMSVSYDFGRLYQNIVRRRARKGTVHGAFGSVSIGSGAAFWGHFLEKGTNHQRARPFFFRAVEGAKTAFYARLNIEMQKRVDAAVKRLSRGSK